MMTRTRLSVVIPLISGLFLSGCLFGNSPDKLNKQIESGKPAEALSTLEEQLAKYPEDPAFNLLAIKARLALCQQRNCTTEISGSLPPLLVGLPKLAAHVTGPIDLAKDVSPLTLGGVFDKAMDQYQALKPQPDAVLAVYQSAPASVQPRLASGLFAPSLALARTGDNANAGQLLVSLGKAENLPTTYTYAAQMLAGMLTDLPDTRDANLIALRSTSKPPLPASAAALLPWAMLAESQDTDSASPTTPAALLGILPKRIAALQLPDLLDADAMGAMARELVAASNNPKAQAQWQPGWTGKPQGLQLALQRTALGLDPNQPQLWATYLPALVSATLAQAPVSGTQPEPDTTMATALPTAHLASSTAPRIGAQVLHAVGRLVNYPPVATPLVTFLSHMELSKQQQIELEKLSQSLLIKAADQSDVTSTLALAQTLPGVAQNNRQSVVPLLVRYIRTNLKEGDFDSATKTASFLTDTLKMDVEFAPLVLEEFTDDLKRRKVNEQLNADTPAMLLQPSSTVALDLGPIFGFMQDYFAKDPKVITAQLTTLVADATGTYGQANAMYRLGDAFPEETLPTDKRQEWLAASLEQALLADKNLSGLQLAENSANLSNVHPGMNLAPLLEASLKRTPTLEEQRTLWQNASPQVREVFRAIRPEFTLLMQGVDALANNQLNSAAQAFANITDPLWRTEAKPYIEQFNDRLITLSGVYVPVSAAPALKTAAIILAPAGLGGGKLNMVSVTFISRVGTLAETESTNLRTNDAAVHRFSLPITYNFDTRSLPVTAQAVAQTAQGGTFGPTFGAIRGIRLLGDDTPTLAVTLADGTTTPFVRTLIDTSQPLRPDGTYLLQSRLGTAVSATQGILPPGSMVTFTTGDDLQAPPADADTRATVVYPLSGSVRHPASAQPIPFTGFYEPDLFTATFTFSYPLPLSAQPARASVRCQALAGPITCGAHNLNSARQAYAALVTGLQTRESLNATSATRNSLNTISSARMLAAAIPVVPEAPTVSSTAGLVTSSTTPPSLTVITASATIVTSTSPSPAKVSVPSPAAPASGLLPAPKLSDKDSAADEDEETDAPTTTKATATTSSSEPEPGAFINHSGGHSNPVSTTSVSSTGSDEPEPGAFINHSGGHSNPPPTPLATSGTTTVSPTRP